jgi:hypothetical protein
MGGLISGIPVAVSLNTTFIKKDGQEERAKENIQLGISLVS